MRKWVTLLLLGSATGAPSQQISLQNSPEQPGSTPTFKTGTKLVEVDVIARDKNGPAAGLTKNSFTVFDNGKPQEISFFSTNSGQTARQVPSPLPPGTVSNRLNRNGEAPRTTTVLLLDRLNTEWSHQVYANQRVIKFLQTPRSQNQLGIYTLGTDLQVIQDLTGDPDLLRNAAESLKPLSTSHRALDTRGELEKRDPAMSWRVLNEYTSLATRERVLGTKRALEVIAQHLANVPGRKNLIWITDGFPLLLLSPKHRDDQGPRGDPVEPAEDFSSEMREAARVLNDANVALYAIDARGLCAFSCAGGEGLTVPGLDTMNLLAGLTGGKAYYANNGIEDSARKIIEDSQLTYTLGFYPPQDAQDGLWHKLEVKVARSGINVRYRENYFAPPAQTVVNNSPTSVQLLNDSLDATQIGLTVQAPPDPERPGFFNVRVFVDLHDVQLRHERASWIGDLVVSFLIEGSKDIQKILGKIDIPEDQLTASLEKGIEVEIAIEAEGQSGVLRVLAQDQTTGAVGSLRVPLGRK